MITNSLLPLEEYAQRVFSERRDDLPDRNADYWARYTHLMAGLRENVYPHINAGLSCLSKSPGIYTDHGAAHFDEVVRYAGDILRVSTNQVNLAPYEIYLLLCAIRLHDAGNIDGREDHEKRATPMVYTYGGNIIHDSTEAVLIGSIAEAHGGRTVGGDKDTIGTLPPDGTPVAAIICRPRQVAAIVRFADEICEHSARAARHHITANTIPEHNKLFHYYAKCIRGAAYDPKGCFKLGLSIDTKLLAEPYSLPSEGMEICSKKYFIDDVWDRISKLELERRYCNQFLDPSLQTNEIEIQIEFTESKKQSSVPHLIPFVVDRRNFVIPQKNGYPADNDSWRTAIEALKGSVLAQKTKEGWS